MTDTAVNVFELFAKIGLDDTGYKKTLEEDVEKAKKFANSLGILQTSASKSESQIQSLTETTKQLSEAEVKVEESTKELQSQIEPLVESTEDLAESEKKAEESTEKLSEEIDEAGDKASKTTSRFSKLAESLKKGLKTAAKVGTAAIGAAATGVVALTKQAVESYAEYEQLVGGAELMFGKAYDTVAENAKKAYATVQMSQSEYLQQVNGFATGLKTALGGDEQAAAELADRIVTAEADIIAATGNTKENVQNAFNGIMKSNFTMLDNLQIGITPTKEGFQEVIDKVNDWNKANGEATNYQMGNLADMQSALVDYIDMVGMSGYAQSEASRTIQGSLASTKAAYSNLITGLADDNANIEELISNFVTSVAGDGTEGNPGLIGNILPRVEKILGGGSELIERAFPVIMDKIPAIIESTLPKVVTSAVKIIESLVAGIEQNPDAIVNTVMTVMDVFINGITDMLPDIIVVGALLLGKFALGIVEAIPDLVGKIPQIVTEIVDGFGAKAEEFKSIGTNIVKGLWEGIKAMGSWLKEKIFGWFDNLVDEVKENEEIHSPSRKWARVLGKPMGQGVGVGAVEGLEEAERLIQGEMDNMTASVTADVNSSYLGAMKTPTDQTNELLSEMINLFKSGKAKTNVTNTRDFRSVSYG